MARTNADIQTVYQQEIDYLRVGGHWSSELADDIPFAVSNLIRQPLIIYSSKMGSPIVNVWPTLAESSSLIGDSINIAYTAHDNGEHYDACIPYCSTPEQESHMDESMEQVSAAELPDAVLSDTESIIIDITPRKRANYSSPKKKSTARKRKRNPDTWH